MARKKSDDGDHYRLKVKAPITSHRVLFRPGVQYTVKAKVYEEIKDVAYDVEPVEV